MKTTKIKIYLALFVCSVLAAGLEMKRRMLKKEIKDLKCELVYAQQYVPLGRDTVFIHDSIPVEVVTSPVITAELSTLRKQHIIDEQTIKDLGLKLKQLDAMQTTAIETRDKVPASHEPADSLFYYSDQWADLKLSLKDSTFYYNIRDSLSTVVYREYRHHFLWWKWGTKGYRLKIVNFNPHARVTYNKYVKAGK